MTDEAARASGLLVLRKITAILDSFTLARPEQTLAEIRATTGLPSSTAQRLVSNLVQEGFLSRTDSGYRIGVRVAYWAAPATQGVDPVEIIKPELRALRDSTEETIAFFRVSLGYRVCTALAETRHVLRRSIAVGDILPLHAGSAGRVLLAWTPDLLERIIDEGLEPITPDTLVDEQRLREAVALTKELGYATTAGERVTGASGIAAPVFNAQADLAGAVSLMAPSARLSAERTTELVPRIVEAAEQLTRILGGRRPGEDL